jgi:hypothetical protein
MPGRERAIGGAPFTVPAQQRAETLPSIRQGGRQCRVGRDEEPGAFRGTLGRKRRRKRPGAVGEMVLADLGNLDPGASRAGPAPPGDRLPGGGRLQRPPKATEGSRPLGPDPLA